MNNKFKTECGLSFDEDNPGEYSRCFIARTYHDEERQKDNKVMSKQCEECSAKKVEKAVSLFRRSDSKEFIATDVYCLCKNVDWKDNSLVKYYDTPCSNTITQKKVEIVLQVEDGRRIFYIEEKGNRTFGSMMEDIPEDLWEQLCDEDENEDEDEPILIKMTDSEGETFDHEVYNEYDIRDMIVSVRLIEFKEFEVDDNDNVVREIE